MKAQAVLNNFAEAVVESVAFVVESVEIAETVIAGIDVEYIAEAVDETVGRGAVVVIEDEIGVIFAFEADLRSIFAVLFPGYLVS